MTTATRTRINLPHCLAVINGDAPRGDLDIRELGVIVHGLAGRSWTNPQIAVHLSLPETRVQEIRDAVLRSRIRAIITALGDRELRSERADDAAS